MEWKYKRATKTYERSKFLIVKEVAYWDDWFTIYRKIDNVRIKSGIKKLSQAKLICEMLN